MALDTKDRAASLDRKWIPTLESLGSSSAQDQSAASRSRSSQVSAGGGARIDEDDFAVSNTTCEPPLHDTRTFAARRSLLRYAPAGRDRTRSRSPGRRGQPGRDDRV